MVPVLIALTWLAVWARNQELLSLRGYLAPYITAGWLAPTEPTALSSPRTRALARDMARRTHGPAAARAVTEYTAVATTLSFHRRRAHLLGPTRTSPSESSICSSTCGTTRGGGGRR